MSYNMYWFEKLISHCDIAILQCPPCDLIIWCLVFAQHGVTTSQSFLVLVACHEGMGRECHKENFQHWIIHHCSTNAWWHNVRKRLQCWRWSYWLGPSPIGQDIKQLSIGNCVKYMNEVWRAKIPMWCVGARWIPHAWHNTNTAIESYHCNLKSVLNSSKERFVDRRIDWLIYHLTGDVLTHYWYSAQCKAYGFILNKKQEGIVLSAIIRANNIPDTTSSFVLRRRCICWVCKLEARPSLVKHVPPLILQRTWWELKGTHCFRQSFTHVLHRCVGAIEESP